MQCQYLYDCDPGESHARPCPDKATATAELTYRHGEGKSSVPMCDYHAKLRTDNLNRWGAPYGHSAQVLPLVIEHKRHKPRRGVSRAKGSRHTASLLNGSYARELGRFE